jgi:hypothetical protein
VAGDYQGCGISGHYTANGPGGIWGASLCGQCGITYCVSVSYIPAGRQNGAGEGAEALQQNGEIRVEIDVSAFKIGGYLLLERPEKPFFVARARVNFEEQGLYSAGTRHGQTGSQQAGLSAGKAEIAKFGFENRVRNHWWQAGGSSQIFEYSM